MRLKFSLIVASLLGTLIPSYAAQISVVAGTSVTRTQIDEIFEPFNRTDSPGCSVALIEAGRVKFSKGYGMANLEVGVPIETDTVFYSGSVSKQFVAFSVALLAEAGKLSLDDEIQRYVPEIRDYGSPITIRHLIYHTSGLRDYLELWGIKGRSVLDSMPPDEVLDLIARQEELNFPPGEKHLYCNSGYFLLALIVERVSGESFREFTTQQILLPLGMTSSHFHDDSTHVIGNKADGYSRREDGDWGVLRQRFALVGSGGLYTTVEDLARWDANFYDNRLGQGGGALIETTLQTGRLNNGEQLDYAFGQTVGSYRGLKTVRHGGALGGYRAHLLRFPEDRFSVAILCNLADVDPGKLANQLADLVMGERMEPALAPEAAAPGPETVTPAGPEAPDAAAADLSAFQGVFYSRELDSNLTLWVEDGRFWARPGFGEKVELKPMGGNRFGNGRNLTVEFEADGSQPPPRLRLNAGRVRHLLFVRR